MALMKHLLFIAVALFLNFSTVLADAPRAQLAAVERGIAYSPVEIACAWTAAGSFLGCGKGTFEVSAPPGTRTQLRRGTVTHNQVYPHVPTVRFEDLVTARNNDWAELRVVQGTYRRAIQLSFAMTLPTWNEYTQTLTTAFKKYGVWFRSDVSYGFTISGSMQAIMRAFDETWQSLAAAHGFTYSR